VGNVWTNNVGADSKGEMGKKEGWGKTNYVTW